MSMNTQPERFGYAARTSLTSRQSVIEFRLVLFANG